MPRTVKRALLIGINYTGTDSALNGCINDAENLQEFLVDNKFFTTKQIKHMNDNKKDSYYPTKENILNQFRSLVRFANRQKRKKRNVELFVSYSGHGTQLADHNSDEEDKLDEVLCPIDYAKSGFILDDEIKKTLIDRLPSNVKLVMLVDACHSGSMCDLRYDYKCDRKQNFTVCGVQQKTRCNVVMISGCKDTQTSSDAHLQDTKSKKMEYQGAMTASFIDNYEKSITYIDLINGMRKWLKEKKFDQIPQLSSGKLINVNKKFLLS